MKFLFHSKLRRIWFLIWFLGTAIYLIVKAIRRYIEFKILEFEGVLDREIDIGVMNFYLTSIIAAIVLSIFCVYCTVFRTGNYANDYMQFGEKSLDFKVMKVKLQREQISRHLISNNSFLSTTFWSRIKCHFPPYYLTLYTWMSVTLLLGRPYLDAEKIKNGIGSSKSPMHSNLDFLFFDEGSPSNKYKESSYQTISFEFFNLCFSLLLQTFSYSHVFWKFNKTFSLLLSFVIFISGLTFVLDLALVEVLVKVSRDPSQKIQTYSPQVVTVLSLMSYLFLIVHQVALFEYGHIRLIESLLPRYPNSCPTYSEDVNISVQFVSVCKQLCIESWSGVLFPLVVGIFSLIHSVSFKLPYIYKSMTTIYQPFKDALVLANLVLSVLFLFLMMVLWVLLILISNWQTKSMESSIDLNGDCPVHITMHPKNVPSLPIYASVNRHPILSQTLVQDQNLCDPIHGQWRYSCSPPSIGPNDSSSDRTVSCQNGDIGNNNNLNFIMMRRGNQIPSVIDSPSTNHGIYSQLIKLTPQSSHIENILPENMIPHNSIPNDISESSSTQTVHIIGPVTLDLSRGTLERSSGRNRMVNSSEYFNILNFTPNSVTNSDIYDHGASTNTDGESSNLCSQV